MFVLQELLSLAKKRKRSIPETAAQKSSSGTTAASHKVGGSADDGSDSDWADGKNEPSSRKRAKKMSQSSSSSSEEDSSGSDSASEEAPVQAARAPEKTDVVAPVKRSPIVEDDGDKSELEEGQVSSDSDSDSDSSDEFRDGYDENLMGDAEDRARLEGLSEKERETEIFKRIEQRDVMRTRWEIERKLRQAKRQELAKDKRSSGRSK